MSDKQIKKLEQKLEDMSNMELLNFRRVLNRERDFISDDDFDLIDKELEKREQAKK